MYNNYGHTRAQRASGTACGECANRADLRTGSGAARQSKGTCWQRATKRARKSSAEAKAPASIKQRATSVLILYVITVVCRVNAVDKMSFLREHFAREAMTLRVRAARTGSVLYMGEVNEDYWRTGEQEAGERERVMCHVRASANGLSRQPQACVWHTYE